MENEPQFKIGDIVILKSDALKHFPIVMTVNEIGMGKDVNQWRDAILLYLSHEEERREKATKFRDFLKEECNETKFAATVKTLAEESWA